MNEDGDRVREAWWVGGATSWANALRHWTETGVSNRMVSNSVITPDSPRSENQSAAFSKLWLSGTLVRRLQGGLRVKAWWACLQKRNQTEHKTSSKSPWQGTEDVVPEKGLVCRCGVDVCPCVCLCVMHAHVISVFVLCTVKFKEDVLNLLYHSPTYALERGFLTELRVWFCKFLSHHSSLSSIL